MTRILSLLLAVFISTAAGAGERVVNIFNWSDYIDPGALEDFTRETGIKVIYDTYDSNEMLESRLLAGSTGYDIVVPSATFLERQIKAGVLQPIDRKRLANARNIWNEIDNRLAHYDPGSAHAINYMWYTTGVAYNAAKIRERLGKPITSWDQVLRPESLKKLADCGVYVLDSPEDIFAITLAYLKLDPNSKREADLRRAADHLSGLRRYIKKFHSSEYINALANGDICLAIGWSGDSMQARNRAREAGSDVEIAYAIPAEGSLLSMDNFAIPVDAPHVAEAYQFIDFMLRPDIAARNTKATNFANGVGASRALIDKSIAEDPAVYPAESTMQRLYTVTPATQPEQKLITRLWTTVKTGK